MTTTVLYLASMWASMMRRTSSAMEMPSRFDSRLRNARCGSVNEIICLIIDQIVSHKPLQVQSTVRAKVNYRLECVGDVLDVPHKKVFICGDQFDLWSKRVQNNAAVVYSAIVSAFVAAQIKLSMFSRVIETRLLTIERETLTIADFRLNECVPDGCFHRVVFIVSQIIGLVNEPAYVLRHHTRSIPQGIQSGGALA
jgi:hypothetical protein